MKKNLFEELKNYFSGFLTGGAANSDIIPPTNNIDGLSDDQINEIYNDITISSFEDPKISRCDKARLY